MKKAEKKQEYNKYFFLIVLLVVSIGIVGLFSKEDKQTKVTTTPQDRLSASTEFKLAEERKITGFKEYRSNSNGYSFVYPQGWTIKGFTSDNKAELSDESNIIRLHNTPNREGNYICVEFRINNFNASVINKYQDVGSFGDYKIAQTGYDKYINLTVLNNVNKDFIILPNYKTVQVTATYNCIQGDKDHLTLTLDEQKAQKEYSEAIEILKSIELASSE